ncbi:hypothetical protein [Chryseobacterium sp.]|uniref:hypothetical protein n=1 Tax=Chryseobacterium sp. TaxID=1871047 RepID=UPI00321BAFBA
MNYSLVLKDEKELECLLLMHTIRMIHIIISRAVLILREQKQIMFKCTKYKIKRKLKLKINQVNLKRIMYNKFKMTVDTGELSKNKLKRAEKNIKKILSIKNNNLIDIKYMYTGRVIRRSIVKKKK